MTNSQAVVILALLVLVVFAIDAFVYREEIKDIQAYMQQSLLPELPAREDLAP